MSNLENKLTFAKVFEEAGKIKPTELFLLWNIAMLTKSQHQVALGADALNYLQSVADVFNEQTDYPVSLPSIEHSDITELERLIFTSKTQDSESALVANLFHYFKSRHYPVTSLGLSGLMNDFLMFRQDLNVSEKDDGVLPYVDSCVVYADAGIFAAIKLCQRKVEVTYAYRDLTLTWLYNWLNKLWPNFHPKALSVGDDELTQLPSKDALVLCPYFGNNGPLDSPSIYQTLLTKYPVIVSYHPKSFFIGKKNNLASERLAAFIRYEQGKRITPLSVLVTLPKGALTTSNVELQLVYIDQQAKDSSGVLLANYSDERFLENSDSSRGILVDILSNEGDRFKAMGVDALFNQDETDLMLLATDHIKPEGLEAWERHVMQSGRGHRLSQLVDFLPTRSFSSKKEMSESGTIELFDVASGDFDQYGQLMKLNKSQHFSEADAARLKKRYGLRPRDVLLTAKSSIGKVMLMPDEIDDNCIPGMQVLVMRCRPNSGISPIYLYHYLRLPIVQQYIQQKNTGANLPLLRMEDAKLIPILLPSEAELVDVERRHAENMKIVQQLNAAASQLQEGIEGLLSDGLVFVSRLAEYQEGKA